MATPAWALPTGANVVAGQATITKAGGSLSVVNTPGTIINWNSFSVGAAEAVRFQQQSATSSVLNRVTGSDASAIFGQLSSNGQVWLINPNGILFGAGARIDVQGLIASTLNVSNSDFLAGKLNFTAGSRAGAIRNEGTLTSRGGSVYLVAPDIENSGIVNAPDGSVLLAAGRQVGLVEQAHPDVQVVVSAPGDKAVNLGEILAQNGRISLFGAILQQKGRISADSVGVDALGRINFRGTQQVELAAGSTTTANGDSGGSIAIRSAGEIKVAGAIHADAGKVGAGGTVIVIADLANPDSLTTVSGQISARGGTESGNGGFIETSGHKLKFADTARIDTSAVNGRTGQWLLDPISFTVAASNGDMTGATLGSQLASNNVTLSAQCATPNSCNLDPAVVDGDIFINDSVSWSTGSVLTLDAGRSIYLNAPLTASGSGGLALKFARGGTPDDIGPIAGNYFVRAPINLSSAASFSTTYLSNGPITAANTINYQVIATGGTFQLSDMVTDGNYVLGSDMTLAGSWAPIGDDTTAFDGIFDGLGHKITGLSIPGTGANNSNVGLFGVLRPTVNLQTFESTPALIQNVGLIDANVAGLANVGTLVGKNEGIIINSYAASTGSNTSVVTGRDLGGIGPNTGSGDDTVTAIGGLVGSNAGLINGSYANVTVTATTGDQSSAGHFFAGGIGGLVGVHYSGTIIGSYAAGSVTGIADVGGFAGYAASSMGANYSRGAVTGTSDVGGFVGYFDNPAMLPGLLAGNFWDTTTSGKTSSGGQAADEVTGMSTAQMLVAANFKNATVDNGATLAPGWQNFGTWELRDGSYPLLSELLQPIFVYANNQATTYAGTAVTNYSSTIASATAVPSNDYSGSVTVTPSTVDPTNAGSYTLTPSGLTLASPADQNGYRMNYVNGTLTINKAHLTVSADDQTRDAGTANPVFTQTISGFVNNENLATSGVSGSAFGSSTADNTTPQGTASITASVGTLSASNYDFTTLVNGTLTINAVALPTLSACIANPSLTGCSSVLPSVSTCIATPTLPGCSVVLPSVSACTVTPSLPGCSVVLPSVSTCIATPTLPGCSVVLPTLSTTITIINKGATSTVVPGINTATSTVVGGINQDEAKKDDKNATLAAKDSGAKKDEPVRKLYCN